MAKREIYRGNFVNFLTARIDPSVVRSSCYFLKIVEDGETYFYKIVGGQIFDLPETTTLLNGIFTDWHFLPKNVQDHYLFEKNGFFFQNDTKNFHQFELNFNSTSHWIDHFGDVLPRDVLLKLYEEVGKFEEIVFVKSYLHEINDIVYKVSEYWIDSDWYLFLGRWRLYGEVYSVSFEYSIKTAYTAQKEENNFHKHCRQLSEEYTIPSKFVRAILKACNYDLMLCSQVLLDIQNTRKMFLYTHENMTLVDNFYAEHLKIASYQGFSHFIKNFEFIYTNFKFTNKELKKQLADFMLGK